MDNKYIPFAHPMFNQTADGKGEPYVHQIDADSHLIGPPFEILSRTDFAAEFIVLTLCNPKTYDTNAGYGNATV